MGFIKKVKKGMKFVVNPLGSIADDIQESTSNLKDQAIQSYMKEYESLSDKAIKKEFKRLEKQSGMVAECRWIALNQVAVERQLRDLEI